MCSVFIAEFSDLAANMKLFCNLGLKIFSPMSVHILPLGKNTDAQIADIISVKKALYISDNPSDMDCVNTTYLKISAFNILMWRHMLEPSTYDVVVFKIHTVSPGLLHAFHSTCYKEAYIFLERMEYAAKLSYTPTPRFQVICAFGDESISCDPRNEDCIPGLEKLPEFDDIQTPYNCYCISFIRQFISENPALDITIFSNNLHYFKLFPDCAYKSQLNDGRGAVAFIIDVPEEPDYSRFEQIFFLAREDCLFDGLGSQVSLAAPYESYIEVQIIEIGAARFPLQNSVEVLLCIINETKSLLEAYNVFIRNLEYKILLDTQDNLKLCLPLFGITVESDYAIKRKTRLSSCCSKMLRRLYDSGYLDEKLVPIADRIYDLSIIPILLITAYETTDQQIINKLKDEFMASFIVRPDIAISKRGCELVDAGNNDKPLAKMAYKRKYMQTLPEYSENCSASRDGEQAWKPVDNADVEKRFRKIPYNLQIPASKPVLYVFNKGSTGILCAESFDVYESVDKANNAVRITRKNVPKPTTAQYKVLGLYQIVFFKLHLNIYASLPRSTHYYYYAVPLDEEGNINWQYLDRIYSEFLLTNVAESPAPADYLIWNPFTRQFLLFAGEYENDIESKLACKSMLRELVQLLGLDAKDSTAAEYTMLDYFENTHKVKLTMRTGRMAYKAIYLEEVLRIYRKRSNVYFQKLPGEDDGIHQDNDDDYPVKKAYCGEREIDDPDVILDLDNLGEYNLPVVISSKEACFVTSIKKSIITEYFTFVENFILFENICIAYELSEVMSIKAPLGLIVQALTASHDNPHCNYEALEFFGDSVLKFIVTVYMALLGHPVGTAVSIKDSLISNKSLYERCLKSEIYNYVSILPANYRMFQAPTIKRLNSFKEYFNAKGVFDSANIDGYLATLKGSNEACYRKMYADIIESIIGILMLSGGIDAVIKFLIRIEVITRKPVAMDKPVHPENAALKDFGQLFNHLDYPCAQNIAMEYESTLGEQEIKAVEQIIGYAFKNPGFLEKALIHPSYSVNEFGSQHFQSLELIGDAALDLFVVSTIFHMPGLETPEALHNTKRSFVNNKSLCMLVVHTKLSTLIKVNSTFDMSDLQTGNSKLSKIFADIFEALVGAILCDLKWDFERFHATMEDKLWPLIQQFQVKNDYTHQLSK